MNNNKNKKLLLSIIGIAILVIAVVGVTFAFFSYNKTGGNNIVQAGNIVFNSTEGNAINLENVFPITSTQALTDTTNAKTLQITVNGNTSYSGGIEYLVTATDVHMTTTTGKTVPVTMEVSVTGNNSKTLGTSNDSYYTSRGGNTSMYKVEYDGALNENDHILVGYIAPDSNQTGVDGIINIKAYINDADILISDTYNDGNPPTDNKGTPVSMGEGKTVLTTTEWNSLTGNNALSFKIKVEARESTWVPRPIGTAIFDTGPVVNAKMRLLLSGQQYNGESSPNNSLNPSSNMNAYEASLVRSNVLPDITNFSDVNIISSNNSEEYIYAWRVSSGDSEIIYWYTDANTIYLNENSSYLFYGKFVGIYGFSLSNSGIQYLNTSRVTNMSYIFAENWDAPYSIISDWDVSNVINMSNAFTDCFNIDTMNNSPYNDASPLNNWDVRNVQNFDNMFSINTTDGVNSTAGFVYPTFTLRSGAWNNELVTIGGDQYYSGTYVPND